MQPNPEAVAWGKRQASGSPRWSDAKWSKVAIIFGVELTADPGTGEQDQAAEHDHQDQPGEIMRDAA